MANDAVLKIAVTDVKPKGGVWRSLNDTILISTDKGLIVFPDSSGSRILEKLTGWEYKTAKTVNAIGATTAFYDGKTTDILT